MRGRRGVWLGLRKQISDNISYKPLPHCPFYSTLPLLLNTSLLASVIRLSILLSMPKYVLADLIDFSVLYIM